MTIQLTVSDLRQYEYCPRIVYFTHCLGLARRRPTTYKMAEGSLEHERVVELEERRSLRSYGLEDGERFFDIRLFSETLKLSGLLDMLIVTKVEAIPVEFKNSSQPVVGANHRIQLGAYALLIEERWQVPVKRAFVHFIPVKTSREVVIDVTLKKRTLSQLELVRDMIEHEALPDATGARGRCVDCEFRNFCPDVW